MDGSGTRMRLRRTNGVELSGWPSSVQPCSGRGQSASSMPTYSAVLIENTIAHLDTRQLVQCQGRSALGLSFLSSETIWDCMIMFANIGVKRMKLPERRSIGSLVIPGISTSLPQYTNARTSYCEAILVLQSRFPLISTSNSYSPRPWFLYV